MFVQRRRDNRRTSYAGSYPHVVEHTTQNERIEFHGIFEMKICANDIRQTYKSKI